MDRTQFGLHNRPFRAAPDTQFYYPATTHESALGELHRALEDEEGFALLTGAPGSGKTLLLHRLLETLGDTCRSIFLTNTHWTSRGDLLQALCFDLLLPYQGRTEQELRLAVTESCLNHFQAGGKTLIVIDEAQHLTADHLEEFRLLSNLESRHGKAVQIVLAGLPEIRKLLEQPALQAISQRVSIRANLEPLSVDESVDYLHHQIRVAAGRPDELFTEEAAEMIARAAGGVPRLLNNAASLALHLANRAGEKLVDVEATMEALDRLGLEVIEPVAEEIADEAEAEDATPALAGAANPLEVHTSEPSRPPMMIFNGADPESGEVVELEGGALAGFGLSAPMLPVRAG